jgi:hypothetical protein
MKEPEENLDSGMELRVSIGLEYKRKRANVSDKFDARISTVGLMLIAGAICIFIIWQIVPKLVDLIP